MQKTNEFVNEATASCLQKEADASSDIPSCINNFKGVPATDAKAKTSTAKEPDAAPEPLQDSEPVDLSTTPAHPPSSI